MLFSWPVTAILEYHFSALQRSHAWFVHAASPLSCGSIQRSTVQCSPTEIGYGQNLSHFRYDSFEADVIVCFITVVKELALYCILCKWNNVHSITCVSPQSSAVVCWPSDKTAMHSSRTRCILSSQHTSIAALA